ncbi:uncharacterized protein LOC112499708 [Cynara cardunculus var. scolymus]|uniref:uncharacterized protein LOC112499708 n=1 Tax=Cynara cardunculus var. scolymus TaxID=59895 RepID=UPI000D6268FD|nr:uncharacterized protein LOC112499708 [Cynara cardunculus var. scolymus]
MQTYGDYGILIDEDKIIHFVNPKKGYRGFLVRWCTPFMKRKTCCRTSYCGQEKVAGSRVRLSCVDCYVKDHNYLYRITYTSSYTPAEVIDRALYLYENWCSKHKRMGINNNQDFAVYCRMDMHPTTVWEILHKIFPSCFKWNEEEFKRKDVVN